MFEDDPFYDVVTRSDYLREAYGDPCPRHGILRWQADCPECEAETYEEPTREEGAEAVAALGDRPEPRQWADDDIPF